jgi:hypothetical protein
MKKESRFYVASIVVSFFLFGCERTAPVAKYTSQDLFPKKYVDSLNRDKTRSSFNFDLCRATKNDWDSVLFIKPYIDKSLISSLPIANYSAIEVAVNGQSFNEGTCTLVFVGRGKYVGYGVFPRNPVDFTTIDMGKEQQLVWVTRANCINLRLNKVNSNSGEFYNLEYKQLDSTTFLDKDKINH